MFVEYEPLPGSSDAGAVTQRGVKTILLGHTAVLTQGRALVVAVVQAAILQDRNNVVDQGVNAVLAYVDQTQKPSTAPA